MNVSYDNDIPQIKNFDEVLKKLNKLISDFNNNYNKIELIDINNIKNTLLTITEFSENYNNNIEKWFDSEYHNNLKNLHDKINLIEKNSNIYNENFIITINSD